MAMHRTGSHTHDEYRTACNQNPQGAQAEAKGVEGGCRFRRCGHQGGNTVQTAARPAHTASGNSPGNRKWTVGHSTSKGGCRGGRGAERSPRDRGYSRGCTRCRKRIRRNDDEVITGREGRQKYIDTTRANENGKKAGYREGRQYE
jgi:hypothetical protein